MNICEKFTRREARLAVIGLGYVGLPLAMEYTKQGFEVIGIDLMEDKIDHDWSNPESYLQDDGSVVDW